MSRLELQGSSHIERYVQDIKLNSFDQIALLFLLIACVVTFPEDLSKHLSRALITDLRNDPTQVQFMRPGISLRSVGPIVEGSPTGAWMTERQSLQKPP